VIGFGNGSVDHSGQIKISNFCGPSEKYYIWKVDDVKIRKKGEEAKYAVSKRVFVGTVSSELKPYEQVMIMKL
jgi:hypothetical protein